MNPLHDMKPSVLQQFGWQKLGAAHLSVLKTFLLLTLPFSLIPPLMLAYAGSHHAAMYLMDAPAERWNLVASAFFVTELLTVPLMAWLIKSIAESHNVAASFQDSFLLATITAIPMWLSAFALAIPDMWTMMGIVILGLIVSAQALYRGTCNILKIAEKVEAQSVSYEVLFTGAIVWVLLCAFVVLPLTM